MDLPLLPLQFAVFTGAQSLLERKQIPQRFSVWSIESRGDLGAVRFCKGEIPHNQEGFPQEAPKVGGIRGT